MNASDIFIIKTFGISEEEIHKIINNNIGIFLTNYGWSTSSNMDGIYLSIKMKQTDNLKIEKEKLKHHVKNLFSDHIYGYDNDTLISVVDKWFRHNQKTLSMAESCTSGWLSKSLTDVPGASTFFLGGFITYSNEMKIKLLGVKESTLNKYGAVSREVVKEMVIGCKRLTNSDYAIAITGIAGPTGGTDEKPIGLIHVGIADEKGNIYIKHDVLIGNRNDIRNKAMYYSLNSLRTIFHTLT